MCPASRQPIGHLIALLLLFAASFGASAPEAAEDTRARIVESTLKDLSIQNDAALHSINSGPTPAADPMDGTPVDLGPEPVPPVSARVTAEVESSLHRLRREAASEQTQDGRKARVDEQLDRDRAAPPP